MRCAILTFCKNRSKKKKKISLQSAHRFFLFFLKLFSLKSLSHKGAVFIFLERWVETACVIEASISWTWLRCFDADLNSNTIHSYRCFFFSAALGSVDYSHLPESLRYIKRKQGALKWENPSLATSTLSKLFVNRNFWKNMIYQMPSVPMGKLGIVTWRVAEADQFVLRQTGPEEPLWRTHADRAAQRRTSERQRFNLTLQVCVSCCLCCHLQ